MYAIIECGGKQYRVQEGDLIRVEKLTAEVGSDFTTDKVLMIGGDGKTMVGTPYVPGYVVSGKVLNHDKDKKVLVFHYKPKKNIRVRYGHRQPFTSLLIEQIKKVKVEPVETKAEKAPAKTAKVETASEKKAEKTNEKATVKSAPAEAKEVKTTKKAAGTTKSKAATTGTTAKAKTAKPKTTSEAKTASGTKSAATKAVKTAKAETAAAKTTKTTTATKTTKNTKAKAADTEKTEA